MKSGDKKGVKAAKLSKADKSDLFSPQKVVKKSRNVDKDESSRKKADTLKKVINSADREEEEKEEEEAQITGEDVSSNVATAATHIAPTTIEEADGEKEQPKTFAELGVNEILCEACEQMHFDKPTPIQTQAIPYALQGRDVMGFAATGSGKTAAFAIPVLQALYENPSPLFCCVMVPTRELAHQISQQFVALGSGMGVKSAVIIGGEDHMQQSLALSRKPHVIVATPGRLLDHLERTKGFSLRSLKFLILDEADRLLDMDFKEPINRILQVIPRERRTFLFSATPSREVDQLQRASLTNPIRVSVSNKITTVETLLEYYLFMPFKHKDASLVFLLNEFAGKSVIVFVSTKDEGMRIPYLLDVLGLKSIPINGSMSQNARLEALNKFKAGVKNILVATNVAARGLDIPKVDVVINFSVPDNAAEYVHRVGRTARAGRAGKAITIASQYDVQRFQAIEREIHPDKRLEEFPIDKEEIMLLMNTMDSAQQQAKIKMSKLHAKQRERGGRKGRTGGDDTGNE